MLAGKGDLLPVSAFPVDGTWPTATAQWEKRNIALEIPVWDPKICIQCNQCALVCPHAAIRAKVYEPAALAGAPATFKSDRLQGRRVQGLEVHAPGRAGGLHGLRPLRRVCPAKDKTQPAAQGDQHGSRRRRCATPSASNYDFFLDLPEVDRARADARRRTRARSSCSRCSSSPGACAGCGETPYLKLLTQLFGDRLLIANATGCSSIYGGNLPTTPYTTNRDGRGPAWSNSLFEDNAEFGLGLRLALDKHARAGARRCSSALAGPIGDELAGELLDADQTDRGGHRRAARAGARAARTARGRSTVPRRGACETLADYLVKKSVWLVGGDGWAYDIGFGGLDHVLATGANVNILVLDTEVYSNTGGQQSKATPLGAVAKFAAAGKATPKKDLGLLAMSYGHVYVARVAFGAKMQPDGAGASRRPRPTTGRR